MFTQKLPLFICIMLSLALAACGQSDPPGAKLTGKDAGSTIHLKQGAILDVTLEGNPTTGYTWELAPDSASGVLEQQGEPEFKPDSSALGSGGVLTLHFKVVQAGTADLKLIYHRTFEPHVPPLQTFAATVVVDQ